MTLTIIMVVALIILLGYIALIDIDRNNLE